MLDVLVTGFPNSGTSFLTHLIAAAGYQPGRVEHLKPPDAHNPWGYWEHLPLRRLSWSLIGKLDVTDLPDKPRPRRSGIAGRIERLADAENITLYKDNALPLVAASFPVNRTVIAITREPSTLYRAYYIDRMSASAFSEHYSRYLHLTDALAARYTVRRIAYEDFADDLTGSIHQVCDWIDRPYHDDLTRVYKPTRRHDPRRGRFHPIDVRDAERFEMWMPDGGNGPQLRQRQGQLEPPVCEAFRAALTEDATVLNVGAGWGYYTLLAAQQAERVIAVEADPNRAAKLRASVKRNGCDNVTVIEKLVGRDLGLDQLPRPDVVLMDVDGWEAEVLRTAPKTLNAHPTWIIEVHARAWAPKLPDRLVDPNQVRETLARFGYGTQVIYERGRQYHLLAHPNGGRFRRVA